MLNVLTIHIQVTSEPKPFVLNYTVLPTVGVFRALHIVLSRARFTSLCVVTIPIYVCAALRDDSTFFKKKKIIINNFQLKKKTKTKLEFRPPGRVT